MKVGTVFRRKCDGKLFEVTQLSHWSELMTKDQTETVFVKYMGGDVWVSRKGDTFTIDSNP